MIRKGIDSPPNLTLSLKLPNTFNDKETPMATNSKKIDFYIHKVHYNSEKTHIVTVKRFRPGTSSEHLEEKTRGEIVEDIERKNLIYFSCFPKDKNEPGKLFQGAEIQIYPINGNKYIRTNADNETRDNLENVEEY